MREWEHRIAKIPDHTDGLRRKIGLRLASDLALVQQQRCGFEVIMQSSSTMCNHVNAPLTLFFFILIFSFTSFNSLGSRGYCLMGIKLITMGYIVCYAYPYLFFTFLLYSSNPQIHPHSQSRTHTYTFKVKAGND